MQAKRDSTPPSIHCKYTMVQGVCMIWTRTERCNQGRAPFERYTAHRPSLQRDQQQILQLLASARKEHHLIRLKHGDGKQTNVKQILIEWVPFRIWHQMTLSLSRCNGRMMMLLILLLLRGLCRVDLLLLTRWSRRRLLRDILLLILRMEHHCPSVQADLLRLDNVS